MGEKNFSLDECRKRRHVFRVLFDPQRNIIYQVVYGIEILHFTLDLNDHMIKQERGREYTAAAALPLVN